MIPAIAIAAGLAIFAIGMVVSSALLSDTPAICSHQLHGVVASISPLAMVYDTDLNGFNPRGAALQLQALKPSDIDKVDVQIMGCEANRDGWYISLATKPVFWVRPSAVKSFTALTGSSP